MHAGRALFLVLLGALAYRWWELRHSAYTTSSDLRRQAAANLCAPAAAASEAATSDGPVPEAGAESLPAGAVSEAAASKGPVPEAGAESFEPLQQGAAVPQACVARARPVSGGLPEAQHQDLNGITGEPRDLGPLDQPTVKAPILQPQATDSLPATGGGDSAVTAAVIGTHSTAAGGSGQSAAPSAAGRPAAASAAGAAAFDGSADSSQQEQAHQEQAGPTAAGL